MTKVLISEPNLLTHCETVENNDFVHGRNDHLKEFYALLSTLDFTGCMSKCYMPQISIPKEAV